jgi:hypothetical protein
MQKNTWRIAIVSVLIIGALTATTAVATAGSSGGAYRLRGNSITVDEAKGISRVNGSLIGTWQTLSFETIGEGLTQTDGVGGPPYQYAGAGTERFTGCHDRNANKKCDAAEKGTLKFTFTYWGAYDPATGALIKGQCQHPILGGTGAFKGASGVVFMKDTPTASGGVVTVYSGRLAYGTGAARTLTSASGPKGCGRSS